MKHPKVPCGWFQKEGSPVKVFGLETRDSKGFLFSASSLRKGLDLAVIERSMFEWGVCYETTCGLGFPGTLPPRPPLMQSNPYGSLNCQCKCEGVWNLITVLYYEILRVRKFKFLHPMTLILIFACSGNGKGQGGIRLALGWSWRWCPFSLFLLNYV